MQIAIKKLRENATLPVYGSEYAAGADLYACIDGEITVNTQEKAFIQRGLLLNYPWDMRDLSMQGAVLQASADLPPQTRWAW